MTEAEKQFLLSLFDFDHNLADNLKIKKLYSLSQNIEKNYKIITIPKKNGDTRKVYSPNYYLKNIQRNILKKLLYDKSPSNYATAYCRNRSVKDNALIHVNKKIILKLDIKHFFDNLSFTDVYNVYNSFGFSKRICSLLTYLSTYKEFLPQGAPTSSYLSNLILYDFDKKVNAWCTKRNINYTRYSDDMTFSMDEYNNEIVRFVRVELDKYGLELNNDKIHIIRNSRKQKITGIVVNNTMQTDINYRKKIRQEIYYIKKYGLTSHLENNNINIDSKTYLLSLLGRINFVLNIKDNREFQDYKNYLIKLIKSI